MGIFFGKNTREKETYEAEEVEKIIKTALEKIMQPEMEDEIEAEEDDQEEKSYENFQFEEHVYFLLSHKNYVDKLENALRQAIEKISELTILGNANYVMEARNNNKDYYRVHMKLGEAMGKIKELEIENRYILNKYNAYRESEARRRNINDVETNEQMEVKYTSKSGLSKNANSEIAYCMEQAGVSTEHIADLLKVSEKTVAIYIKQAEKAAYQLRESNGTTTLNFNWVRKSH